MKKIEFEDNQGVVLQYTAAGSLERVAAFVIDYVLLAVLIFFLALLENTIGSTLSAGLSAVLFAFWSLLQERISGGRSLGKWILGLQVVKLDGSDLRFDDSVQRWVMRIVDVILSSGTVAILSIEASPRAQRIGDVLADTTVVKTRNLRLSLKSLLSLDELAGEKSHYPQAVGLEEKEVLFIQEALERYKKNTHLEHKELLEELSKRICHTLDISPANEPRVFLEQLMRDYVRLTR